MCYVNPFHRLKKEELGSVDDLPYEYPKILGSPGEVYYE